MIVTNGTGSDCHKRDGTLNGTGSNLYKRDGRKNGNGSGLKKLPSKAAALTGHMPKHTIGKSRIEENFNCTEVKQV